MLHLLVFTSIYKYLLVLSCWIWFIGIELSPRLNTRLSYLWHHIAGTGYVNAVAKEASFTMKKANIMVLYLFNHYFTDILTYAYAIFSLFSTDEHRILVEPACGASLAIIYSGILENLQRQGKLPTILHNVVIIVCGGNIVSMETLTDYRAKFLSNT